MRAVVSVSADHAYAPRPVGRTQRGATRIAEHLVTSRKLQGLTAQQVADRANISRPTPRKLETGVPTLSLEAFLDLAWALGQLDKVIDVLDPYESDLGRARAYLPLPKRVRR